KDGVMFNDILGTTLGIKNEKGFDAISMTAFGEPTTSQPNNSTTEIDKVGFFTGKPYIGELGYAFLFRNYRADQGKWQTKDPLGYPDGWNNLAYVNNIPLALVDPLGLSFWNSISSIASSTWNAITNVASNPTFQNSLAATSGALQVATGIVLGGTTGWTGVGAVAAGALILNGASTLAMGVTNLSAGSNFNTSGFAGALTSVMTNNPTANQLASAFDLTTNLFAGGFAVSAANSAATATILPGTMGGYLANFNLGDTAYANLLINGSTAYDPNFIVNTLTATSAISSTVNSINNIINSGGIVAE
ncbi:MAG: hypothetical protein GX285_09415, partial [Clostridiales bacterium]|nr:hypothetical protein [Clostridiales bacterium]